MRLVAEARTGSRGLPSLAAAEVDRVGATRSGDLEVGHTMGPPSERPQAISLITTADRSRLTPKQRLRYTSGAKATPRLFHGIRDASQ
jgi:hypothetical protein